MKRKIDRLLICKVYFNLSACLQIFVQYKAKLTGLISRYILFIEFHKIKLNVPFKKLHFVSIMYLSRAYKSQT